MKKLLLFSFLSLIVSCVSVNRHNEKLEIPISVENLRKDVDFTKQKLEELHPKLYWFISKDDLNHQFDSLKTTIQKPLKPNEFYQRLAPVIAKVKEGHLRLYSYEKRFTKKEIKDLDAEIKLKKSEAKKMMNLENKVKAQRVIKELEKKKKKDNVIDTL